MEKSFVGQTAVITGAGIGIGFEIAKQLCQQGAQVVLNDIDETVAKAAAEKLSDLAGQCIPLGGDSSDPATIEAIIQQAVNRFGKLDLAIANAGITTFGGFLDYSVEDFQRLSAVNLQGTFFLAQTAAKQMITQNSGGSILMMSSVTGHSYHPNLAAYGMSKAAIRYLAQHLGVELAKYQINVNAISPGATMTERTEALEDGKFEREWNAVTPSGRCATTDEIARTSLFLLSPQNRQITGQCLVVDGGWTSLSPPPH
ncbi:MAG: SDR family oxidoreductase [Bacteroidota bacterium]